LATSGTVGRTVISTGQILDHAFRRCVVLPQQITNEHIDTAKRILWMQLSMLNIRSIALWAIDTQLLGLTYGQAGLSTRVGNLDLLNANLRQVQRIDGFPTSTGGSAGNAYDQDLTTLCTEAAPNGNIVITFTTNPSPMTQVGVYPAASGTWSFNIDVTTNGIVWTTVQSVVNQAVTAGTWLWYDVDAAPAVAAVRIQATSGTILNVGEVMCGNNPSDIPFGILARDEWTQLPNKQSLGRPTIGYWDRRITTPIFHIWPAPDSGYTLTYLAVLYVKRQLQDVGTLPQQIELPDRWYLPVIADLARNIFPEIKEAKADPNMLAAEAERLMTLAWQGENPGGTAKFIPNIRGYTA
jgi:hypothetical protein